MRAHLWIHVDLELGVQFRKRVLAGSAGTLPLSDRLHFSLFWPPGSLSYSSMLDAGAQESGIQLAEYAALLR